MSGTASARAAVGAGGRSEGWSRSRTESGRATPGMDPGRGAEGAIAPLRSGPARGLRPRRGRWSLPRAELTSGVRDLEDLVGARACGHLELHLVADLTPEQAAGERRGDRDAPDFDVGLLGAH